MKEVENRGNLITRRAFAGENNERSHRMQRLAEITYKAMPTAYKYAQELPPFGSGIPSPLFVNLRLVEYLEEADRAEASDYSTAYEYASAPLLHLAQLRGGISSDGDQTHKMNFLMKSAADANYLLKARELEQMTPGELKEFSQKMLNAATVARELGALADEVRRVTESSYPGAPFGRERVKAVG